MCVNPHVHMNVDHADIYMSKKGEREREEETQEREGTETMSLQVFGEHLAPGYTDRE